MSTDIFNNDLTKADSFGTERTSTATPRTRCGFRDIDQRQCWRSTDHSGLHDVYGAEPRDEEQGERHTPTPWRLQHEFDFEPTFILAGEDEELLIAKCDPDELPNARQNAAFIVRAVNAHQKLVETLRLFKAMDNCNYELETMRRSGLFVQIDEALALADRV